MALLSRIASFIPLLLVCISFAFTIVALVSRDWTRQYHYDALLDMADWEDPIYTLYRSPFRICEVTRDQVRANSSVDAYNLQCTIFRAYGFGKTSCEVVHATKNYSAAQTGDQRLCQQIHRSGDLAITSTTFITLGFILTIAMTVLAFIRPARQPASRAQNSYDNASQEPKPSQSGPPLYLGLVNLFLIVSLSIGAITAVLSQFYGIIAFIQSQPDNGLFAGGRGNTFDPTQDNSHGPWVEGQALKAWVTCAWVFAVAGAGAASAMWSLPRKITED